MQKSLESLKQALTTVPALRYRDTSKPFLAATDGSSAVGAVLSQLHEDERRNLI